jgi:hypothetical protein
MLIIVRVAVFHQRLDGDPPRARIFADELITIKSAPIGVSGEFLNAKVCTKT